MEAILRSVEIHHWDFQVMWKVLRFAFPSGEIRCAFALVGLGYL